MAPSIVRAVRWAMFTPFGTLGRRGTRAIGWALAFSAIEHRRQLQGFHIQYVCCSRGSSQFRFWIIIKEQHIRINMEISNVGAVACSTRLIRCEEEYHHNYVLGNW